MFRETWEVRLRDNINNFDYQRCLYLMHEQITAKSWGPVYSMMNVAITEDSERFVGERRDF